MAELLVAQVLWLLGQDDKLFRPRAGALPVAVTAGALIDVVDSGAARWADTGTEPQVKATGTGSGDALTQSWASRIAQAAGSEPIPVIHAINALGGGIWDTVGADLAGRGMASEVPRRVRRWLPPKRRPNQDIAHQTRTHLRKIIAGTTPASPRDHAVLAVASCAGVVDHILSQTAFTDSTVLASTQAFLQDSPLVRRLERAVSYLVGYGPTLGVQPF